MKNLRLILPAVVISSCNSGNNGLKNNQEEKVPMSTFVKAIQDLEKKNNISQDMLITWACNQPENFFNTFAPKSKDLANLTDNGVKCTIHFNEKNDLVVKIDTSNYVMTTEYMIEGFKDCANYLKFFGKCGGQIESVIFNREKIKFEINKDYYLIFGRKPISFKNFGYICSILQYFKRDDEYFGLKGCFEGNKIFGQDFHVKISRDDAVSISNGFIYLFGTRVCTLENDKLLFWPNDILGNNKVVEICINRLL